MSTLTCSICTSPYRKEIEFLIKKNVLRKQIAEKYCSAFNTNPQAMESRIRRHIENKHKIVLTDMTPVPPAPPIVPTTDGSITSADYDKYAERLLQIGMSEDLMNTSQVKHKDVLGAQKLLVERQKVKVAESALKASMAKFFRGRLENVIEGEEVEKDENKNER